MTNEQLAILLRAIKSNLDNAIDTADSALANEERYTIQKYVGTSPLPLLAALNKKNPAEWVDSEGCAIALDPIREESEKIQAHIDALAL